MTPTTTPPADPLTTAAPTPAAYRPLPIPWEPRPKLGKLTAEQAETWAGQFVAWDWEGTTILAGAPTREDLDERLIRAGTDPRRVIVDYVDRADESNL